MLLQALQQNILNPSSVINVPVHRPLKPFEGRDFRFPAQQPLGLLDTRPGLFHIGLMKGLVVDDRFLTKGVFAELPVTSTFEFLICCFTTVPQLRERICNG